MEKNSDQKDIEDSLADSIADSWLEIQKKAEDANPEEMQNSAKILLEWLDKLTTILKGPPR